MKNQNKPESIDKNRRKFLTVMLIGSGAFLVEKILTPLFSRFLNDSSAPTTKTGLSSKASLGGFRIVENKEIFQIDKEM